jgi:hypothetical protein
VIVSAPSSSIESTTKLTERGHLEASAVARHLRSLPHRPRISPYSPNSNRGQSKVQTSQLSRGLERLGCSWKGPGGLTDVRRCLPRFVGRGLIPCIVPVDEGDFIKEEG